MRYMLASLDSVASAADGIQKGLKPSCLRGDLIPDLSQQSRSTRLSRRFNPPVVTSVLNPSIKQARQAVLMAIKQKNVLRDFACLILE